MKESVYRDSIALKIQSILADLDNLEKNQTISRTQLCQLYFMLGELNGMIDRYVKDKKEEV